MKDYLEHRQYVIHELPKAEVNEKIELFVRLLGEAWLDEEVDILLEMFGKEEIIWLRMNLLIWFMRLMQYINWIRNG